MKSLARGEIRCIFYCFEKWFFWFLSRDYPESCRARSELLKCDSVHRSKARLRTTSRMKWWNHVWQFGTLISFSSDDKLLRSFEWKACRIFFPSIGQSITPRGVKNTKRPMCLDKSSSICRIRKLAFLLKAATGNVLHNKHKARIQHFVRLFQKRNKNRVIAGGSQ